ncbi:restriction endonuclease subunit S [Paraliobacillus sediminis]|uniref:restriction endonuclease subunit S n=1 Tax=Paraliobacillus sediminis TaxID=1885916 RepID=UPI000E3BABD4|nr:restriction endonuclease subunit S [Paraliobacillus sediminis]
MKSNVQPEVRFAEFTDDWEQRKLGEVADFFDEKRIPIDSGKRRSGRYPYYGASGVIDYVEGYIFDGEYVLLAEDGANITIRNSPIAYITEGKFWLNNHAHIMKIKYGSNRFLLQLLEKQNYEKYNSGTAQPKLNGQVVKKITLGFPNEDEQQKIGTFFKQLDDAIALQQRQLERLKDSKKGFLRKMFPKDGERVPEVRFSGFVGDWKNSKLEDELTLLKDGTHGTHKNAESGPYLLSAKNIKNGKVKITEGDRKISQEEYEKIHKNFKLMSGDILLTIVGSIGEVAILNDPTNITFQRSVAYLRPSDIRTRFLYTLAIGSGFQKELKNRQVVSAQPGIYLGDLKKITLVYPSDVEEQQKIGTFFKQLDDTIVLHEKELELLKETKKGFLQKMFV